MRAKPAIPVICRGKFFLIFLVLLINLGIIWAQDENNVVIGRIDVILEGEAAPPQLKNLIPLRSGDSFSPFLIREAIQHLYRTGLFADIKVFQVGDNPIDLTFWLQRQLYLRQSLYVVEKGLSAETISREIQSLRGGEFFDENLLVRARKEIANFLEREGYFNSTVDVAIKKIHGTNFVDLIWKINPGERLRIRQVYWKGEVEKLSLKDKAIIDLNPGDEYNPRELQSRCQSLQQRLRSQGFPRAEVNWMVFVDKEKKLVEVEINPWLYEKIAVEFKGAKIPPDLIVPLWEEKVFEEWALSEGEARIRNYLRRKGYLQAKVESQFIKKENFIQVNYTIILGPKQTIREIVFSGNKNFSENELREVLGLPTRSFLTGLIDGERVFELPRRLEAFYQMKGFSQAKVFLTVRSKGKKLVVYLNVDEGPQNKIGMIKFQKDPSSQNRQDLVFSDDLLLSVLGLKPGDAYYSPLIKLSSQKIINFYQEQGFRGTLVQVEEIKASEGIYDLCFKIKEGVRYRVRQIYFTGALTTKQMTIQKELRIKEGDWANASLIQESKRNLERLGIFTLVQVEEIFLARDQLDLVFRFYEGERSLASVGLGFETRNEPRSFEIWNNVLRLRGTAEIVRTNLFGDASQLSFVSQLSLKETRGVVSWEQPYFFGLPLRGYLNMWLEREERISFGFDRRGLSLTGIRALKGDLMSVVTLRYTRTVLTHLEITESEVDRQFFPFSSTSFSASLIHDRRNDTFNPENGYFASGVFEWAFPMFGSEADFLKGFFKYQRFYSLAARWNLSGTFRLGLGRGRMPIHERFFAGGSNSFRGQEFDELGPKDSFSQKPVGGKALILFNFELTFPFLASLPEMRAAIFYDLGNVFGKRSQFSLASLEHALGFGIRYRTPFGPLRLEVAWNIKTKKPRPLLFITIGQIF
ncbi:MAG: outer membrane protein assembly factor BamA [Candidatus Aminicenantes bacterium]|nr:outer membrane protein assembly factor BamA [Candidatus Aminicenantes bacterium]